MDKKLNREQLQALVNGFQPACVVVAGAELGLFDALANGELDARELAKRVGAAERGTAMLADALAALGLLNKSGDKYSNVAGACELLCEQGEGSMLAYVRHQANCLRNWAQLANVVKTGRRADRTESIRGAEADHAAFIEAMNELSRLTAPRLVEAMGRPQFRKLLDVGGGPGTWTIEFLRACPGGSAVIYDLPQTLPIARRHVQAAGLQARVALVAGDFEKDERLPAGADLAWVSAIIHMNSRQENRELFAKVHAALEAGGRILIRDVVMEPSRTEPAGGAMFAINMLVNTPSGGTFTFDEIAEDLAAAGFVDARLLHRDTVPMNCVIEALKRGTRQ